MAWEVAKGILIAVAILAALRLVRVARVVPHIPAQDIGAFHVVVCRVLHRKNLVLRCGSISLAHLTSPPAVASL